MIDTVLFDMGGTLEDIYVDADSKRDSALEVIRILREKGITVEADPEEVRQMLDRGWKRYAAYRDATQRELKPEEIWGNYILTEFGVDFETAQPFAEELAYMWEVTYYHRALRPGVPQMLEGLQGLGLRLGVISNTASLYQVYEILEKYGIRGYFQDVTLSSVTGYRKPNLNIFKVALYQMRADPACCAYVGDTFSRDVIGPQKAGFGMTFHIQSFLTKSRDADVSADVRPTYSVNEIYEVYTILRDLLQAPQSRTAVR